MKVALVHELLTMRGGAERVLRILADMFPEAPIYTLLYDERKLGGWFPRSRVRPSSLQKWATFSTNHHLYLSAFPDAVEQWNFSEFDLVISTSSAFAHGVITNGAPKHLCYVNSPARYLWDRTHDVLERAGKGFFGGLRRRHLEKVFHRLRIWDSEASDRPDMLLAASKEVQRRVALYWRRESAVLYPPLDDHWITEKNPIPNPNPSPNPNPYFLIVSTLVTYKKIDLAIRACMEAGVRLRIAGEGPAKTSLQRVSGPSVDFLGYCTNEELRSLYVNAEATLFPGEEDFGLVPLESMACGTPVIAYRAGGALETVVDGKTGMFFDEATPESLAAALQTFDRTRFDPEVCRAHAARFSRHEFEIGMRSAVASLMH